MIAQNIGKCINNIFNKLYKIFKKPAPAPGETNTTGRVPNVPAATQRPSVVRSSDAPLRSVW